MLAKPSDLWYFTKTVLEKSWNLTLEETWLSWASRQQQPHCKQRLKKHLWLILITWASNLIYIFDLSLKY